MYAAEWMSPSMLTPSCLLERTFAVSSRSGHFIIDYKKRGDCRHDQCFQVGVSMPLDGYVSYSVHCFAPLLTLYGGRGREIDSVVCDVGKVQGGPIHIALSSESIRGKGSCSLNKLCARCGGLSS